jgi:hypothetical protein
LYTIIESKEQVSRAQRQLEATLKQDFRLTAVKNIGHPGGTTLNAVVFTNREHWYWTSDLDRGNTKSPRQLNWYGLMRDGNALQIGVEINTLFEGHSQRLAGFFARDNATGAIYLLHSGRVGGGTKGVGQDAFLAWSNLPLKEVVDSAGRIRKAVLITPVKGRGAGRSVTQYIDTVVRFKGAVRSGELKTAEFQRKKRLFKDFYAEARGRRKGRRQEKFDYLTRHGEIVDALYKWRTLRALPSRGRIVKDVFIDMGIAVADKLVEVFEVKSGAERSSIYAAIGQLMVHGTSESCRRVIVLPHSDRLPEDIKESLARIGVELLRFRLDDKKVTILPRHEKPRRTNRRSCPRRMN